MLVNNFPLRAILRLSPKFLRLPIEYHYRKLTGKHEPELIHLKKLIGRGKRAIDVGANRGLYTYALAQICDLVEAFEPQNECATNIREYSQRLNPGKINVHVVALSKSNGSTILNIPILRGRMATTLLTGLATSRELTGECQTISVPTRRLDDYNFENVSFIKIDVEGHEIDVIAGGRETILREKPIILVEIVEAYLNNKSIERVFQEITSLGYEGSFLHQGELLPLSYLTGGENQASIEDKQKSINNFIFTPCP
jgi:FkbM family methyltransferase